MEVPQTSPSGSKVVWITKFFWNLLSEVGLNFLCNVFCPHCHHGLKVPTPLRFPGLALLSLQPPSFKWESFKRSVIPEKNWYHSFFLRRQAAVQGSVKKKRTEWKTFMFAKSKSLPKVDPHTTYYMISNTQTKTCESVLINYLYRKWECFCPIVYIESESVFVLLSI